MWYNPLGVCGDTTLKTVGLAQHHHIYLIIANYRFLIFSLSVSTNTVTNLNWVVCGDTTIKTAGLAQHHPDKT